MSDYSQMLTAPNFTDIENPIITFTNPTKSYPLCAVIWIREGNLIKDIVKRNIAANSDHCVFYFTDSERDALRRLTLDDNALNLFFAIRCMDGEEIVMQSSLARIMTIVDAQPLVTGTVIDINDATYALTGDRNKFIKYHSIAQATLSAEPRKYASINEDLYIIRHGEETGYGTSHIFYNVGETETLYEASNAFIFSAEDSRGNIGTDIVFADIVDYIKPTCNISQNRPDGNGNMTVSCNGDFFNGSFGAVSNTIKVQFRYTEFGSAFSNNWLDMAVTYGNSNRYSAMAILTGLDYKKTYSFEARAIDKLETITSTESAVKGLPLAHWGKNDFVFEVPVEFKQGATGVSGGDIEGDCRITGDLRLKGDGNFGNTLYFGDGSYAYITEPYDDALEIKAKELQLNANSVGIGGELLQDFVVEEGKEGSWSYRVWHSGIAECWITITKDSAVNNAWGSSYVGTAVDRINYPVPFISRPREVVSVSSPNDAAAWLMSNSSNSASATGIYNTVRATPYTSSATWCFDIYVIGRCS